MKATVVITTRNRADDLRRALRSCMQQSCRPEVLVVDDASTDETVSMVRSEFPSVRLTVHERPTGYIVGRNEAADTAAGDVIVSIDDDAEFTHADVVAEALQGFGAPRVGAVAIPYIDVRKSEGVRQLANSAEGTWVTDRYIGTAHAVRRDLFLQMGGYRECFFHQGEERDFCLRLLDAGYYVRLGSGHLIHHYESPQRDLSRMDYFGRRNDILFAWLNCPGVMLPAQLAGTTIKGLLFGFRVGRPFVMCRGVAAGWASILKYWRMRAPVSSETFREFRRFQKSRAVLVD